MLVLGLDIGYSALKCAYGVASDNKPVMAIRPANAGPADRMPSTLSGVTTNSNNSDLRVTIDDKEWAAGVEPGTLQNWPRELHKDYTRTDSYKALFYAALAISPTDSIDMLVTGMPVSLFSNENLKQDLISRLSGNHLISPKRTVHVSSVKILPQPAGAYMDLARNYDQFHLLQEGRCITIDPGHFSVDYVAIERGQVRDSTSGTSLKAMSVILDKTNELIAQDYGMGPGTDRLESAMLNGRDKVYVSGREVTLTNYFNQASDIVSNEALTELRKDMRQDSDNVDLILLTGGGAESFVEAARRVYPECSNIVIPEMPQLANARGFWEYGRVNQNA